MDLIVENLRWNFIKNVLLKMSYVINASTSIHGHEVVGLMFILQHFVTQVNII